MSVCLTIQITRFWLSVDGYCKYRNLNSIVFVIEHEVVTKSKQSFNYLYMHIIIWATAASDLFMLASPAGQDSFCKVKNKSQSHWEQQGMQWVWKTEAAMLLGYQVLKHTKKTFNALVDTMCQLSEMPDNTLVSLSGVALPLSLLCNTNVLYKLKGGTCTHWTLY